MKAGFRVAAGLVVIAGACGVAPAHADSVGPLQAAIDAARAEAGCPAFQLDPKLSEMADQTAQEVQGWVTHTKNVLPVEDSTVMLALAKAGYKTIKARMLAGYADDRTGGTGTNRDKSVKAAVVQGLSFNVMEDCSYTKYGLAALSDDGAAGWPGTPPRSFDLTSVIVAA